MAPPTDDQRLAVQARLADVVEALTSHPQWNPSNPNQTLMYIWDFASRSAYMLSEYDNVKNGRPVQHPEQFKGGAGRGEAAAVRIFQDVCGRTTMLKLLTTDNTGFAAMLTGSSGPPLDFGSKVRDAVTALAEACPPEHAAAGMRA